MISFLMAHKAGGEVYKFKRKFPFWVVSPRARLLFENDERHYVKTLWLSTWVEKQLLQAKINLPSGYRQDEQWYSEICCLTTAMKEQDSFSCNDDIPTLGSSKRSSTKLEENTTVILLLLCFVFLGLAIRLLFHHNYGPTLPRDIWGTVLLHLRSGKKQCIRKGLPTNCEQSYNTK